MISIQNGDFDVAKQYALLTNNNVEDGAVVTFVGLVRDFNQGHDILGMTLEHYPGMTEKALHNIEQQAREKWSLGRVTIIHRIGQLNLADQIVFVGVTSQHRNEAFAAAQFIMDTLKTDAPFWKKERTTSGERWVQAQ